MLVRVPDYFDQFACLAGDCPHSCCIGWEVVIDEDTARRYRAEPGPLGEKLRAISVTGFSTFFVDVAMGILTVLFNRQIMKYLGMARSFRSASLFSAVRTASGRRRSPSFP